MAKFKTGDKVEFTGAGIKGGKVHGMVAYEGEIRGGCGMFNDGPEWVVLVAPGVALFFNEEDLTPADGEGEDGEDGEDSDAMAAEYAALYEDNHEADYV